MRRWAGNSQFYCSSAKPQTSNTFNKLTPVLYRAVLAHGKEQPQSISAMPTALALILLAFVYHAYKFILGPLEWISWDKKRDVRRLWHVQLYWDAVNILGFIHPGKCRLLILHGWPIWTADTEFWNPDQDNIWTNPHMGCLHQWKAMLSGEAKWIWQWDLMVFVVRVIRFDWL